jgi:hypothetical protein
MNEGQNCRSHTFQMTPRAKDAFDAGPEASAAENVFVQTSRHDLIWV